MSLTVDTKNAGKKAQADPYTAGMMLLGLGFGEVSQEDVKEVALRIRVANAFYGGEPYKWGARDLINVRINNRTETFSQWVGRLYKNEKTGFKRKR